MIENVESKSVVLKLGQTNLCVILKILKYFLSLFAYFC